MIIIILLIKLFAHKERENKEAVDSGPSIMSTLNGITTELKNLNQKFDQAFKNQATLETKVDLLAKHQQTLEDKVDQVAKNQATLDGSLVSLKKQLNDHYKIFGKMSIK